jgi:O-antigen/teichoic acid export membrane protein
MKIRRALALSAADRYASMLVGAIMIAAVSRILTPREVGVTVLGLTIFALVEIIRDVPTAYLIQRQEATREAVRTSFTIMLSISCLAAALLFAAAPTLAAHQGDDGLTVFFRVIALTFLIGPFERPLTALLRRDMAFDCVAVINVACAVSNAVLTIGLALLGFSYMACAWALLGSNLTSVVLAHAFSRRRGVLGLSLQDWRSALRIGGSSGLWGLTLRFTDTLPNLAFGALGLLGAVGLFGRAQTLVDMPAKLLFAVISPVALSALSARQRGGEGLKRPVLEAISHLTAVHWPAFLLLALLAHPVTMLLLGPQWVAVVPILQVLALSRLFAPLEALVYPVLMALGAPRRLLLSAMVPAPVYAIAILAAVQFGPMVVAACYLILVPISGAAAYVAIRRPLGIGVRDLVAATGKSLVATIAALIGPVFLLAVSGFRFDLSLGLALCAGVLAVVGWVAGLAAAGHPLWTEIRRIFDMALQWRPLRLGAEP